MENFKKIVLAYSGGLDTSIMITWLKENYKGCEVIAVTGNVGQGESELEGLEEKAKKTGASKLYVLDLKEEIVKDYIVPTIKAGAKYENVYLLGTPFSRPLIAEKLVEITKKENADAICHGCTGKGNDQVRFELGIRNFAPDMPVIVPWRSWEIKSREDEIEYAEKHNVPLKINRETNYSKDKNIWHLSHEGLDLENPANEPKYDKILEMGVTPQNAPDKETILTLSFEKGVPVSIDGEKMSVLDIILKLNEIGGKNGIGILDMVENRLVGMKSRGVYETPGGTIIYKAHEWLETLCLDKDTMHYKEQVASKFGELLYEAKWFTPLREALSAFIDKTQETVTGTVKLKLYKGNIINAGMTSEYSLYSEKTASFGEDDDFNQEDAKGFINLYGLPTKVKAKMKGE
ncbi:MAG: argininosuccinate synthase [Clostridia bacterium]|nr:argininosuccinate synthase [Clostridia bacterium]